MTDRDSRPPGLPAAADSDAGSAAPSDVISLPDLTQESPGLNGTRTQPRKGRHFGARPVDHPLDAWLPAVRCTKEQRAAVEVAARDARLSLNAFQRLKLCGTPGPRAHRSKPTPDMLMLAQVKAGHGRIGGNLQQFVKRMNSYDFRGHPELQALRELAEITLREHREASAALMRALGGSQSYDH